MFAFYRQFSSLKIYFIIKRLPVTFNNISLSWIAYYYKFNFLLVVNFTSCTPVPLISSSPHTCPPLLQPNPQQRKKKS